MRYFILQALFVLIHATGSSQQVFFRSAQSFSKEDMNEFYSSVAVRGDYILFNGTDYKLYAYKKDGSLLWYSHIGYKRNTPPFFVGNRVWATAYENRWEVVKQFDIENGSEKKIPGLYNIYTQPVIRGNILYATGIAEGGCVFGYDLEKDSLLWQKFLAHGCSTNPYYLSDRIVANAEGDHWIDIRYDGKLADSSCEDSTVTFPAELKCARQFELLSHDDLEIKQPRSAQWISDPDAKKPSVKHTKAYTFILHGQQLSVIGNRLKQKAKISLDDLVPDANATEGTLSEILNISDEKLWMAYGNCLVHYNYKKHKMEQFVDLSQWEPHQVVLDDGKIWLISKKDGLLYGLDPGSMGIDGR